MKNITGSVMASYCAVCMCLSGQAVHSRDEIGESLWAAVGSSPPEIGADLILGVLEQPLYDKIARRSELLDLAESLIRQVKYPARIKAVIAAGRSTDSDIGMLTLALDRRLDRRSLSARLVELVVANQPDRARQLLEGLSVSPLATLSCSEGFAWTSEDEFRAVRTILKSGFSPAARAEGRATQFLIEFINHLDHPAQFEPLMALLVDLSLPRGALQEAVTATGSLFGRSRMDPRSTQALYSPSISQRLRELLDETRKDDLDGTAVLLEFVKYLRKAGSQTRCEDADGEARAAVFLSSFRRLWKDSFPNPESVDRIPESSELVSKEAKGKSDAEAYWKAGRDAEMATLLRKTWQQLDQPTVGQNTLNMAKKTELMQILLRRVEEWRGASKGEKRASSEFNKACLVYRELIERAPEDAIRATIAQEYVSFLSRNEMLAAEPVLWYLQVQLLIELEKKPSQTLLIQTAIRQEGHPLIRFRQLLCSGGACEREGDTKH